MRARRSLVWAFFVGCGSVAAIGCGGGSARSSGGGGGSVGGNGSAGGGGMSGTDGGVVVGVDGGAGDPNGNGSTMPPPGDMATFTPGPPITSGHVTTYGSGGDFRDVSTDASDNIWAVTPSTVYYLVGGTSYAYDQKSGLARSLYTYTDDYYCIGSTPCPATNPVSFSTVSGGNAGQAFVGNIGYTGDRLDVDPASGAVRDVVGMQVTATQQSGSEELPEQQRREIASWRAVVDLDGPMNGRAYFGGFHGLSALNGMNAPMAGGLCGDGCAAYEEHVHPFSADNTTVLGRDIRAIALTAQHDVWIGDADALWFFPQLSAGADSDFFQKFGIPGKSGATSIDVFAGVDDYIYGVAVDGAGGIWVASGGNGLAYLAPGSYATSYWTTTNGLPQNNLTGLAIDGNGDVWMGTGSAGVARFTPSTQTWDYLTEADGLPSNDIRAIHVDRFAGAGKWIWVATDNGVAVYKP
ncbi:MAG TPA: two-component regulator propeller domain-containing protein [Polyangia bacterium]|nr:two-component regulator propeller domain-containing protein [Polyangia bacterium]